MKYILTLFLLLSASTSQAQEIGPVSGSLVIAGGAVRDANIYQRFIDLAGGPHANIVVIPTAGGGNDYDSFFPGLKPFHDLGAQNVSVVHTNDPAEADTDAFTAPIRAADGVWFSGGRQWRIVDAYAGTMAEAAFRSVLDRGGVIGGSSAGATIQGSYLARGDTRTNTVMMGDHEVGFGYLKDTAIDQHLLRRNRQFDLLEIIEARPELLGIGIDENTALVVRGDMATVIGESYVAIYDNRSVVGDRDGGFYFLAPGDRINLATREAVRLQNGPVPIERVSPRQ